MNSKCVKDFITIGAANDSRSIAGVIMHDYEIQPDCDYHQEFDSWGEGDVPTRYSVTIQVKEIGPL